MNKQSASASSDKATMSGAKSGESISDSVQTLVDQGAETIDQIKARVSAVTDDAKTRGTEIYDRTSVLVRDNPIKSLAIAFGLGYIAMRITTSKLTSLAMIAGVVYAGSKLIRS